MDDGGDAADQCGAPLSQSRHRCHQEGIQTHVANHFLTPLLCLGLVAMETWELRVSGNENQLLGGKEAKFKVKVCKIQYNAGAMKHFYSRKGAIKVTLMSFTMKQIC